MICTAVLSVLLLCAGPVTQSNTVHAETIMDVTVQSVHVSYLLGDEEPDGEPVPGEEAQRVGAVMYLVPSIVIAIALTFMVVRQKIENRNNSR